MVNCLEPIQLYGIWQSIAIAGVIMSIRNPIATTLEKTYIHPSWAAAGLRLTKNSWQANSMKSSRDLNSPIPSTRWSIFSISFPSNSTNIFPLFLFLPKVITSPFFL